MTTNVVNFPAVAPASVPGTQFTPDQIVSKLLALRAKIKEIKEKYKQELIRYNEAEAYLEGRLLSLLNDNGVNSMRVNSGTFYTARNVSVRVDRWSDTLDYIRENNMWELLEARVNKTAAMSITEETKTPIPGVAISADYTLHVRSA